MYSTNLYTTWRLYAKKFTFFLLSATYGLPYTHTLHDTRATRSAHLPFTKAAFTTAYPSRRDPGPLQLARQAHFSSTLQAPFASWRPNAPRHTRCPSVPPHKLYGFTWMARKKIHSQVERQFFSSIMPLHSPLLSLAHSFRITP